jgi:transcriptional regulator with XRE-family HTH domain
MGKFGEFLNKKHVEYNNQIGRPAKMKEFAAYLDVPPTSYSNWVNSGSVPSLTYVNKMAKKLGMEVYDAAGYARPTPQLPLDKIPQKYQELLSARRVRGKH